MSGLADRVPPTVPELVVVGANDEVIIAEVVMEEDMVS